MSYLAIYRRFRPTVFEDVIGQDAIVKTLTNQIKSDRVGHAYLFTGARGTGKTTLAKIFAKAVNCLNDVNGSPCGNCKACISLSNSSNIDIVEMDAASNNKVENVREIRESVQYPPVNAKYKVYIIDEVHMLTSEAFNALLKTLEEPPKHAIFILATTEPHKLPATILSRCMRFDFRLVSTKEIANLISKIYDELGKKYTQEALIAIAKAGEGSVRDALSVADLCVSASENELSYDDVINVLGATDSLKTDALVKAVLNGDVGGVLQISEELYNLGKSVSLVCKDAICYVRDLVIVKTCKKAKEILSLPDDKIEAYKQTANLCDEHRLMRVLEIISSIESQLRYSTQPRAVFETALIKASLKEADYNIDALLSRINALETKLANLNLNASVCEPKTAINYGQNSSAETVKTVEKVKVETVSKQFDDKEFNKKDAVSDGVIVNEPTNISEAVVKEEKVINEPTEKKVVIKDDVNQTSTVINSTLAETKNQRDDGLGRRAWGTVVRRLRTMEGKTILWVASQEMSATVIDGELIINAGGSAERNLVSKEENMSLIKDIVKEFGILKVSVLGQNSNSNANDDEAVKEFFGSIGEVK